MNHKCLFCQSRSIERLLKEEPISEELKIDLSKDLMSILCCAEKDQLMPELTARFHKIYKQKTGNNDPYKNDKELANKALLEKYTELKNIAVNSEDSFNIALRLAIAGNIIDLGIDHQFDINDTITKVLNSDFGIDNSSQLEQAIAKAQTVLYLGDNCGEVVLDKLFLETVNHPNVYFAVRGDTILNDVTEQEAYDVGIDKYAQVISNGYGAPSTLLKEVSAEFLDVYNKADLIISKGMGNFEGLYPENDTRIFFLLMVKCSVVADQIGLKKGDFVAMNSKEI